MIVQSTDKESKYLISSFADVQSAVNGLAKQPVMAGVSSYEQSTLATILSELGMNIVKYAGRGSLRVCRSDRNHKTEIDIWAEDNGPGIADIEQAMQDYQSTGGTLGLGLPGVRRMSDKFWIRSDPDKGVLVFARKNLSNQGNSTKAQPVVMASRTGISLERGSSGPLQYAIAERPFPGTSLGGDRALALAMEGGYLLAMIDATGHGQTAYDVAALAAEAIEQHRNDSLIQLMKAVHNQLINTIGAAAGLAFVDYRIGLLKYLGVGNTRAFITGTSSWQGISSDGVLGQRLPGCYAQEHTFGPGDMLVMATDGLPDYELREFCEKLYFEPPAEIGRQALQEYARPYDDACCLVMRWQ